MDLYSGMFWTKLLLICNLSIRASGGLFICCIFVVKLSFSNLTVSESFSSRLCYSYLVFPTKQIRFFFHFLLYLCFLSLILFMFEVCADIIIKYQSKTTYINKHIYSLVRTLSSPTTHQLNITRVHHSQGSV